MEVDVRDRVGEDGRRTIERTITIPVDLPAEPQGERHSLRASLSGGARGRGGSASAAAALGPEARPAPKAPLSPYPVISEREEVRL
jgi:hypothetical protein